MDEKKEGYSLTPMQYFELTSICDMPILKSFVENRLSDVKKVPNMTFRDMMEDYDRKIVDWKQKSLETDYNMVFYSLAFFTSGLEICI